MNSFSWSSSLSKRPVAERDRGGEHHAHASVVNRIDQLATDRGREQLIGLGVYFGTLLGRADQYGERNGKYVIPTGHSVRRPVHIGNAIAIGVFGIRDLQRLYAFDEQICGLSSSGL